MAAMIYYLWIIAIILLLSTQPNDADTPEDMDQETYCSICKISAEVFHRNAPALTDRNKWSNSDDRKLREAWNDLCVYKNFIEYKDQHPVKAIVKGCKFLQESAEIQTSDDGEIEHNSMFEMVKQMVLHKGEVREMKSAMCHTTSNACKALNKSISDLDGKTLDISPEAIQKILDNPNIRKPSPIRSRPEL